MNYGAILIVAAYLAALQLATRTKAGALICAFVAVGIPYAIGIIQLIAINASGPLVISSLFPFASVLTFVLQFITGFIVFKKAQDEEGVIATASWAIGGFILIVSLIPFVVEQII